MKKGERIMGNLIDDGITRDDEIVWLCDNKGCHGMVVE